MPRRRLMQRPVIPRSGVPRPNMTRNANMARRGGKPNKAMAVPKMLTNPGKAIRQTGAMPAGMKPKNSFWSRIRIIDGLINLITWLFFPKAHLRIMQRKSVGTGLRVIRGRALRSRRNKPLSRKERAQSLRNRMPGLTQVKSLQHDRGRMPGVLKHPGERKAA